MKVRLSKTSQHSVKQFKWNNLRKLESEIAYKKHECKLWHSISIVRLDCLLECAYHSETIY